MQVETFEIKGFLRKSAQPCDDCGEVADLTAQYPERIFRCAPCNGVFTCTCCGWPNGEYRRRASEFEHDPDDYVCPYCREGCKSDAQAAGCRFAQV